MAFLFKSKKNQANAGLPPASRNIHTSEGATAEKPASLNGAAPRDAARMQSPPPSNSVSNSLNSVAGTNSPDPLKMRQRAESESLRSQSITNQNSPTTSGPSPAQYPWSRRRLNFANPQANPFPRYGAAINAVASKEGDIYMMGGLVDGATVKGDLWMVESSGGNLSCFPISTVSEGPGPRVGHASLLVGNAFIVFGGDTKVNEHDVLDDTLYLLNTSSRQWSRAIPPGTRPSGRYGHTLNILGSKLYVFGGQVEGYFFNDLVAFDLNALQNPANKWEFLIRNTHEGGPPAGQVPPARTNHTMITYNDHLYLFGGTNGVTWFNDVWSYDPRTNQWSELECNGFIPSRREGHAATLVGDTMYVFGGRNEEGVDLGDLSAFRIGTRRWFYFQNMGQPPSPRSGHSMTAFGKQIIVLAGEPSSGPRDAAELSMAYILDTSKIRYPADDKSVEGRKMSNDKSATPGDRVLRDGQGTPVDQARRIATPPRESTPVSATRPLSDYPQGPVGPNSRLPRASIAQAPGPPPPGQAPTPTPRTNGPNGQPSQMRNKTPTKQDRIMNSQIDTARANNERDLQSPKDSPKDVSRPSGELSPVSGGRRTPNTSQPASKLAAKAMEAGEAAPLMSGPTRQRSLQKQRQRASMDSTDESVLGKHASPDGSTEPPRTFRNSRNFADEPRSPRLTPHQEALIKELEAARNRNAWYASELALARKAGYVPNPSSSAVLDERAMDTFTDEDRPLIEAFLAMRAELAKMQATVDRQAAIASKRVAEVEHQRDAAISEAAYARAKLAAHGGSQRSSPLPEGASSNTDEATAGRMTELSRRLALALTSQGELKSKLEAMTADLEQEKQARELAEETNEATRKRLAELEMQNHALELESLRAELHQAQARVREESALRAEAESNYSKVNLDKEELVQKLEEASTRLKDHGGNMSSLREAVTASAEKASVLERHLEEERERREGLERKLLQLRADHEERTAELETATRRLKDAEELAETHAREAESHKLAFISGLDRASSFDSESSIRSITDQRVVSLQAQVDKAHELVKVNQAAADDAAEKLRRAEERIAGLEAYQEQVSREGLQLRRQLQNALKESQALAAENKELKSQLESQQRDTSALAIQHGALKDLLGERGVHASDTRRSPLLDSPGPRFGTPEQTRLRELEQQLQASLKAHEETKLAFESREQEADRAYREKLEQLENDYQSAVHYVKGTEKMLKRMKDEVDKYRAYTTKLQGELEAAQKSHGESADWEKERAELQESLSDLKKNMSSSIAGLESQISQLKEDLSAAQAARDSSQAAHEEAKRELVAVAERTRVELEQLKQENSLLESRAVHAEQKVSMLLDQMVTSMDNHRRQSHHGHNAQPISRSHSTASTATISGRPRGDSNISRDDSFLNNRSSMALDSLANELDALRSHWENNNRNNHRLSSTFDLDQTPTKETYDGTSLSESVTNWRRRLEEEENRNSSIDADKAKASHADMPDEPSSNLI